MSSIPAKDWKSVWELLTSGIRDYVRKNGFTDVVLGLSGGMDSALVAALAVDALGKDHVHGVMMPSPWSSEGSITDSEALAANLGMETFTVPISPMMEAFEKALALAFAGRERDVTEENIHRRAPQEGNRRSGHPRRGNDVVFQQIPLDAFGYGE